MASPPPATAASAAGDHPFVHLDSPTLLSLVPLSSLIPHLRSALPSLSPSIHAPHRHSHPLSPTSTLLLMPAWSHHPSLPFIGVKVLTILPSLSPAIHATYLLSSSLTGRPLASLDATLLTLLRTAAVSALASSLLSRPSSSVLIMVGAGALAPHLIAAHCLVRPTITRVIIWNRSPDRAHRLALQLSNEHPGVMFEHVEGLDNLDEVIPIGDIVSCATGSEVPIVRGRRLKKGAHLDLVGSFTLAMRECDDEVTVFKSVGTAVVDILAAQLAYESYLRGHSEQHS